MSGFCKPHDILCSLLRLLILLPVIGHFVVEKHVMQRYHLSNLRFHIARPQSCLLVDSALSRLRSAEFRTCSLADRIGFSFPSFIDSHDCL